MATEINVVVELEGGSSESQPFKRMLRMWKNQLERRFLSREEPYRRRRCLIVQLNLQPLSTTKKRLVSIMITSLSVGNQVSYPTASSIPEKEILRTIKSCFRKLRHNFPTISYCNPYPNWIFQNLRHYIMFGRDNVHDIVIHEYGCVTFFCSFCSLWSLICYSLSSLLYFKTTSAAIAIPEWCGV